MASESSATEHGPTASEYVIHHLTFLQNKKQGALVDFSVINYDSIFFTLVIGAAMCFLMWLAARKASVARPGRLQVGVEMLVEMVDDQAKSIVHNAKSRLLVVPLALTIYIWVILMNSMDFPAGRSAAVDRRARLRRRASPGRADRRPVGDDGAVDRRPAAVPVLQRQDQGRGRLGARADHRAVRRPLGSLSSELRDADSSSSSPRRFHTACGCSATCMQAN